MMLDIQWAQFTGDGKTVAKIMYDKSERQDVQDYDQYEADVIEFVKLTYKKSLNDFEISGVFGSLFAILRKHRIKSVFTHTMVNVTLLTSEGVGRTLDGNINTNSIYLPMMARLLGVPVPEGHIPEE